jgi:endonuclease-3
MVRKTAAPKTVAAKTVAAKTARKQARKAAPVSSRPSRTSLKPSSVKPPVSSKARKQFRAVGRKPADSVSPPWTNAEIEEGFRRFQASNPEPVGELHYVTPFTLLVAVVLSAQATDAGVNKATPALFAAADTPAKMVALGEARVRDLIKTIGLFRTKAKNIIALSTQLMERHGGEVPRTREELEALAGVGRKTANVVLNIAFGEPTIAVDTHIFRIGNRTGLAPGKTPFEVESKLERLVPPKYMRHAHHWLILHGRYVCMARRPRCETCLIADLCKWPGKIV